MCEEGYIQLAGAVVKSAIDEYTESALSLNDKDHENAQRLEKWFLSGYAQTLMMGHGETVLVKAKDGIIDAAINRYANARIGAYVAKQKLKTAKSEKSIKKLNAAITRNKSTYVYMFKWFCSPWADGMCEGESLKYYKKALDIARELITEYKTAHHLI